MIQTVLTQKRSLLYQVSGLGCEQGFDALECRVFFLATIPFIRGAAYSAGAVLSARIVSLRRPKAAAIND
jgi:hypothetical protein